MKTLLQIYRLKYEQRVTTDLSVTSPKKARGQALGLEHQHTNNFFKQFKKLALTSRQTAKQLSALNKKLY